MPVKQRPPFVLAMLLADTVLHDMATDKYTTQAFMTR